MDAAVDREHVWTARDIGTNSISGIMKDNNSLLKTLENIAINPLGSNSANIRKVRLGECDEYLSSIKEEHDKYLLNRVVGLSATEGVPDLVNIEAGDTFNSLEEWTARLAMAGSFVANQLPPLRSNRNSPKKDKKSTKPKMHSGNVPPLHTVPGIYLDENFNLGNPHTFSAVCEYLDVTGSNSDSFTTQKILQEKLSDYLDVVEIHLMKEISSKSSGFFSALENLQILHSETKKCITRISELQEKVQNLSNIHVKKGLEIVKLKRERGNYDLLLEAVKIVYKIKQTQPVMQVLLNKGDYVGALDLMEFAGRTLNGSQEKQGLASPISLSESQIFESRKIGDGVTQHSIKNYISKRVDLKGVKSLGHLPLQLLEISRTIYSVMEAEVLNILTNDLSKIVATPLSISSPTNRNLKFVSPMLIQAPLNFWIDKILDFNSDSSETMVGLMLPSKEVLAMEKDLKEKLTPVILGLMRMNKLTDALNTYKTKLLQDIKILSKKHYPADFYVPEESSTSPTNIKDRQSKLAKQLKAMAFQKFFDLLLMVYITTLHILQRISIFHSIICTIILEGQKLSLPIGLESIKTNSKLSPVSPAKSSPGKSPPNKTSPTKHNHARKPRRQTLEDDDELGEGNLDYANLEDNQWALKVDEQAEGTAYGSFILDSAGMLASACDLVHVRCAKLIGARSDQHAMLNPHDFYRFYGTTWQFVNAAESLTGRMCFGLKGAILSQAKAFLNIFHEERSKQIAIMIENEQWIQVEVPVDFQQMLNEIIKSAPNDDDDGEEDPRIEGLLKKQTSDLSLFTGSASTFSGNNKANSESKMNTFLKVAGKNHFVVGFMLLFIKAAHDYIQVGKNIPTLTTDVLHRLFDLLKLVNSKACQMILGAGALKSAGLKNITAKHIAYTSQSLGVIITMIPELKSFFTNLLPAKQLVLLEEFEKLLKAINWDEPDPKEISVEAGVSNNICGLVKETCNLHKVLIKYLPVPIVKSIMTDIFSSYDTKLEEDFKKINFYTSSGKGRLLKEIGYYLEILGNLSYIDGPSNHLEIAMNNIKIKDPLNALNTKDPSSTPSDPLSGASMTSQPSNTARKPNLFFNMRKP